MTVALGKEYSHEWSVQKTLMQDSAKGREVISDNMMEKIEPDVKDLENGVVSNVYLKERYRNCVQYHDQKFDISEAAHVLERNTEMMLICRNLENLCLISMKWIIGFLKISE